MSAPVRANGPAQEPASNELFVVIALLLEWTGMNHATTNDVAGCLLANHQRLNGGEHPSGLSLPQLIKVISEAKKLIKARKDGDA